MYIQLTQKESKMTDRISEKNLVFPALFILAQAKVHLNDFSVSTTDLKKAIYARIEDSLSDEDLEPLKNRGDSKIDQVIRNLISNKTLEKSGFAEYNSDDRTLKITAAGFNFVSEKLIALTELPQELRVLKKEEEVEVEPARPRSKMR